MQHQEMAVADPWIEGNLGLGTSGLEGLDQLPRFFGADVASTVISHDKAIFCLFYQHQVATEGCIFWREFHAQACCLQGRATAVYFLRFVTKQGKVGHVTARWETFWHGVHQK